jgi:hypothetical protein
MANEDPMILLQSQDKFDDLAVLEPDTGQLTWYSKEQTPDLASHPIAGHIAYLNGHMLALYRDTGVLHFRIDDNDFALTRQTRIELARGDVNILKVVRDDVMLLEWTYKPPIIEPPLDMDPTPFVEEEDFDFGLFVYNVTKDAGRRNRIYSGAA